MGGRGASGGGGGGGGGAAASPREGGATGGGTPAEQYSAGGAVDVGDHRAAGIKTGDLVMDNRGNMWRVESTRRAGSISVGTRLEVASLRAGDTVRQLTAAERRRFDRLEL